jgi:uncharacterized protein (DUF433 family)
MHIISKILEIKLYKIIVLFDEAEKREIDFESILKSFPVLKDEQIFKSVKLDDYPTLSWDNLAAVVDYDGKQKPAALDFSPDSLYAFSKLIK